MDWILVSILMFGLLTVLVWAFMSFRHGQKANLLSDIPIGAPVGFFVAVGIAKIAVLGWRDELEPQQILPFLFYAAAMLAIGALFWLAGFAFGRRRGARSARILPMK